MMRKGLAITSYPATAALERALMLSAESSHKKTARRVSSTSHDFHMSKFDGEDLHSFPGIEWSDDDHDDIPFQCSTEGSRKSAASFFLGSFKGVESQGGLVRSQRICSSLEKMAEVPVTDSPSFESRCFTDSLEKLIRITPIEEEDFDDSPQCYVVA